MNKFWKSTPNRTQIDPKSDCNRTQIDPKSIPNRQKINQKTHQDVDQFFNRFFMALGTILVDVASNLEGRGAKMYCKT